MDADRYQQVAELLEEAFRLPDTERADFLDRNCSGDSALRREVETLLGLDGEHVNDPLDEARLDASRRSEPPVDVQAGDPTSIGEYRIVRRLGVGGMGVVFEAEQQHPRRRVALKLMTAAVHRVELARRFGREIELLGRLQHTGIAQIHAAGSEDLGRGPQPWFAMELVDGRNLTAHADAAALDTNARLDLFARVCDAIAFAHQKGVIHRDIKPDNILVTAGGDPKVLDFGVARATDADLQSMTVMTEVGQIMGTLPYMSPEQVGSDPAKIDHRSDIYALGVVLFELLSGRRPHDLGHRSIPEASRIIREEDSTRLGSLDTRYRGDVETIVGKALEKEAGRRYESAAHLASDVRRYLAHEPILAHAPSSFYQIRKFAHRHRGLVGGVLVAFVALAAGLLFVLRSWLDEARQRDAADRAGYRSTMAVVAAALESRSPGNVRRALDGVPERLRGWEWRHFESRVSRYLWDAEVLPMNERDNRATGFYGAPVRFSADGERVMAPLGEQTFGVFEASTGIRLRVIGVGAAMVGECFLPVGEGVAVATEEDRLVVWDDRTGRPLYEHALPGPAISSAWDPESRQLAVSCRLGPKKGAGPTALLAGSASRLERVMTSAHPILTLAWTNGGHALTSMTEKRRAMRIDPRTWEAGPVTSVAMELGVAVGGGVVARRANDERVLLFDSAEPGAPPRLALEDQLQDLVRSLAVSRDGRVVVAATREGRFRVWDARSGELMGAHEVEGSPNVAVSPTGDLAAVNARGRLAVWRPGRESVRVLHGSGDYFYGVAWTPDGRTLVARTLKNEYFAFDAVDGRTLFSVPSQTGGEWTKHLPWALSTDGRTLVSVTLESDQAPSVLCRFDLDCGVSFEPRRDHPWPAETHEQRRLLLSATGASGRYASRPRYETNPSATRSLSVDGTALEDADGRVVVPLVERGYDHHIDRGDRREVDASFSPDGSRVVVARPVLGAIVHDSVSGERLGELIGHSSRVYCVAFSPDGTRIASGGIDRTIRIWDASTYEQLAMLKGHSSYVKDLAWNPDGQSLASASGDGTVRVWTTLTAAEQTVAAQDERRRRGEQRPRVVALFARLDDPVAVAAAVRSDDDLDDEERHAALRVVRELANDWWETRRTRTDDGR